MKKCELQSQIKDMKRYIESLNDELIHGKLYKNSPKTFNHDVPFNVIGCFSYYLKFHGVKDKLSQSKVELEKLHTLSLNFIEMLTKNMFPFCYGGQIRYRKFWTNMYKSKNTGKWMFFSDKKNLFHPKTHLYNDWCEIENVEEVCQQYMQLTNLSSPSCKIIDGYDTRVICFYVDFQNYDDHLATLSFLLQNNLIPKTKNGHFYNISFKLDSQTRNKEYGQNYKGQLHLSDFIDLDSGEIKDKIHFNHIIKGDDN